MNTLDLCLKMLLIRRFEERLLELFSEGALSGTTHTCIGQEAIPVCVTEHLLPEDVVWSNHRGHGHYIARTGDIKGLLAEIMGLPEGICGGRGGSQHICNGNFYSNGVLGSTAPIAAGMALALKKSKAIVVLFLGDGAMGEGVVYETMNIASLWKLPILFVLEDNGYAQTTRGDLAMAGSFYKRFSAFGIKASVSSNNEIASFYSKAQNAIRYIRRLRRPYGLICNTYRLAAHSKGDDFRESSEIDFWKKNNPLDKMLEELPVDAREKMELEISDQLGASENEVRRVHQ